MCDTPLETPAAPTISPTPPCTSVPPPETDPAIHLPSPVDFKWLADNLSSRPTRLCKLTKLPPTVNSACDASGVGMGRVIFDLWRASRLRLWCSPFPHTLTSKLVSFTDPSGTVTNSDLELAATLVQHEGCVHTSNVRKCTTHTASDNTPAVAWQHKGSAHLLWLQALHKQFHRHHLTFDCLPETLNRMADDASHLWHLSDSELLTHFNSAYPQDHPCGTLQKDCFLP